MTAIASRLLRPGRLAVSAFLGGIAGAGSWVLGMDPTHAVSVGILVLAAGIVLAAVPEETAAPWDSQHSAPVDGARGEVRRLSWALRTRRGRVRLDAVRRVRALSASRLRSIGLELDDPADAGRIRAAIGAEALGVLESVGGDRPLPTPRAVVRTLDALDRLDRRERTDALVTTEAEGDPRRREPRPGWSRERNARRDRG